MCGVCSKFDESRSFVIWISKDYWSFEHEAVELSKLKSSGDFLIRLLCDSFLLIVFLTKKWDNERFSTQDWGFIRDAYNSFTRWQLAKWSFQFQSVLEDYDLFDYFDGTNVCPPKYVGLLESGVTMRILQFIVNGLRLIKHYSIYWLLLLGMRLLNMLWAVKLLMKLRLNSSTYMLLFQGQELIISRLNCILSRREQYLFRSIYSGSSTWKINYLLHENQFQIMILLLQLWQVYPHNTI